MRCPGHLLRTKGLEANRGRRRAAFVVLPRQRSLSGRSAPATLQPRDAGAGAVYGFVARVAMRVGMWAAIGSSLWRSS
jgi:hypothetical protein